MNVRGRLAQGYSSTRGKTPPVFVCRRPKGSVLDPQFRAPWCSCVWEVSGGVVWSLGDGEMYTVRHDGFHLLVGVLLTLRRALANDNEPNLRVYSTGDGPDVYEDNFMKIAKPDGQRFYPTLILVGTRLGIDKVTPAYWEALIASLQMPQSIGIAG